jgi:RHH-type proline utilization regulon transcriptional repressor/proline dehydrogenase/delta 1-pyrroline-5-carboxylate dehydrogenase
VIQSKLINCIFITDTDLELKQFMMDTSKQTPTNDDFKRNDTKENNSSAYQNKHQVQDLTVFKDNHPYADALNQAWRKTEPKVVSELMGEASIPNNLNEDIQNLAFKLATHLRERKRSAGKAGIVQGLLQEFSLSSQEGVALMCLAEALLRIPDSDTRDQLIRDKINQGNWKDHVGHSSIVFVNAAAWGLMLTGKLMETPKETSLSSILTRLIERGGRGIIRKSVDAAMHMMGEQFVTGETIQEALGRAKPLERKGFRYSYDMLGEAALTAHDAKRYFDDYVQAIHGIGKASKGQGVYEGAGISIKLSALHPRYQRSQIERVHEELYDTVLELARLAKSYDIGLTIDAEESERLEISLEILERLCFEPELADWNGIGFVIQAYQKRAFIAIDYVVDLAKRSGKRLSIRLVKGAYWDSEIKKAQIDGMPDYPVFTRKVHTDLSYIACAKKLLQYPDEVYPQFATHNAQSLATIYYLADPEKYYAGQYEFQCLHGMGEPLYEQVVGAKEDNKLGIPCRIYAPVGNHETLLAYLVRRLLENGANTSFVNRIADKSLKIEDLIEPPIHTIENSAQKNGELGLKHPSIPLPQDLYPFRQNSTGFDLNDDQVLFDLNQMAQAFHDGKYQSAPILGGETRHFSKDDAIAVTNPALTSQVVGYVNEANMDDVERALANAVNAQDDWANTSTVDRANYLKKAADLLESNMQSLMVLLCRESGKTYANAISEVREAVDFLRYYAAQVEQLPANAQIKPLGTVLCISPWNFPLAIFIGQIAAALVCGNCVIAKPAEQTPLIASQAVQLLWEAGIPHAVVQMLPGQGNTVGAALSQDDRIQGIMFTGSTEVARILQKTVSKRLSPAGRPIPVIAETGGQNAMIVDSTALTEQVVIDVLSSAFDSAGQRCSALRILCVQEDSVKSVMTMLKGAMQQLSVGNPALLKTDIGPVIDREAKQVIDDHIEKMKSKGYPVHQLMRDDEISQQVMDGGTFVAPTLIELPNLDDLEKEIFGPVLHMIRYKNNGLNDLLQRINHKGYGLTMGLHTRIDQTMNNVKQAAEVGNLYINRNIVGAVVGVQPFGGEGLSGTGPKAGGPLYIYRLMAHSADNMPEVPFATESKQDQSKIESATYHSLKTWAEQHLPDAIQEMPIIGHGMIYDLPGPTGERNQYVTLPRNGVLSIADHPRSQLQQLLAIFYVGAKALMLKGNDFLSKYQSSLPKEVLSQIQIIEKIETDEFDAVLHHGSVENLAKLQQTIAARSGAVISISHLDQDEPIPLERLLIERAISNNTAAVGGNTSLMTLLKA